MIYDPGYKPMTNDEIMPFAFGVSEFTTMPWTFEQDIERYAKLRVTAIELCEQKLDDARYVEQVASIAASGLVVCAVQPLVRTFFASRMAPDPSAIADRVARMRTSIERLARFAPGAPFIVNTGAHPKGDMDDAMRVVGKQLKELAMIAADHGIRIALEPLNPTSVNIESAIWTIDQALSVIDSTGRDEIGLCLDYWNVWQDAEIETAIGRAGDRIFYVQASDWRTPRSFADRIVPGKGIIPLGRLMRATYDAGYRGPCVVEIFSSDVSDSLYTRDLGEVIIQSRVGLNSAWTGAERDRGIQ